MAAHGLFSHIQQKACPNGRLFCTQISQSPACRIQAGIARAHCLRSRPPVFRPHAFIRTPVLRTDVFRPHLFHPPVVPLHAFLPHTFNPHISRPHIFRPHASGLWRQHRTQPCRKKFADTGCPVQGFPYLRHGLRKLRKLRRHAALACKAPCWQAPACLLPATPDVAL